MSPATQPLVVLEVLDPPDGTTRYVDQVVHDLPDDVRVSWFTWRTALTGRYDVLHVHWPERLVRSRRGRLHRLAVRGAFCVLMLRLAVLRTAIVRTEHNVDPHEDGDRVEQRLLAWLRRRTTVSIRLNAVTPAHPTALDAVVPLGHFRERFAAHPRATRVPGRVVYAGIIRDYKGVDLLLDAFAALPDRPDLSLRVVGRPHTDRWRAVVEDAVAADPRISARLEFVDDATLVAELTAAELTVLPYRDLHNSGALLVAMSLDVPALVTRTPTTAALAAEVGPGWIRLLDGELDAAALAGAVDGVRTAPPAGRPELDDRDWSRISRRYGELFHLAREATRRVSPHPGPPAQPVGTAPGAGGRTGEKRTDPDRA